MHRPGSSRGLQSLCVGFAEYLDLESVFFKHIYVLWGSGVALRLESDYSASKTGAVDGLSNPHASNVFQRIKFNSGHCVMIWSWVSCVHFSRLSSFVGSCQGMAVPGDWCSGRATRFLLSSGGGAGPASDRKGKGKGTCKTGRMGGETITLEP